jgi:hypothetical protein
MLKVRSPRREARVAERTTQKALPMLRTTLILSLAALSALILPATAAAAPLTLTADTPAPALINSDGTTTLGFELGADATVDAQIVDAEGGIVADLNSGDDMAAGHHSYNWDGTDSDDYYVDDGVYTFVVSAEAADGSQATARAQVRVDGTKPTLSPKADSGHNLLLAQNQPLTITVADAGSGVASADLTLDDSQGYPIDVATLDANHQLTYLPDGGWQRGRTYTFSASAADAAGNQTGQREYDVQLAPPPALPQSPAGYKSRTVSAGQLQARVAYKRSPGFIPSSTDSARLAVLRAGKLVYNKPVPLPEQGAYTVHVNTFTDPLVVRDLDGDGEPELVLSLFVPGPHCCELARIYRFTGSSYSYSTHDFGNPGYRLAGNLFFTGDDRFSYRFTSYAGSAWPLHVLAYRKGKFVDVTRSQPARVRADAASHWRWYLRYTHDPEREPRGELAAWAADEALLGKGSSAFAVVAHQKAGGAAFARELRGFLTRSGYLAR